MQRLLKTFFIFIFSTTLYAAPKVVVTISPIYALTEALMQDVAEPILLVPQGASPHNYALKPSQVSDLNSADLVIWVGESLETFLIKTISQLPQTTKTLTLLTTPGLNPLHFRTGHTFEQDTDEAHTHTGFDPHVWLDPIRTEILVSAMAAALINIDPEHKNIYQTNTKKLKSQLAQLNQQLSKDLAPIKNKPFIVFHDAYQYLEQRYQLSAVGAVTLNPEIMPSAKHVSAIQHLIKQKNVVCIFAEPQFKPAIVDTIAKGTGVKEGVLDPITIKGQGFEAYRYLLTTLSGALQGCLQ
ncbi:MAG: zinc ABC transporter substrate-binding protein [Gammaproteobacteria bacterium]